MQYYSDSVTDQYGNAKSGVSVQVLLSGVAATIYSDNGITIKANPMTTGSDGSFDFYAANGTYTVTAGGTNKTVTLFDAAATLAATTGASLVGYSAAETYAAGTVGAAIKAVVAGSGATNLAATLSATNIIVTSDTGADATLPAADGVNAGLMVPAQVTKLAGIATGATANSPDATLLARANHTGTQLAATISDFAATTLATVLTGLSTAAGTVVNATHTILQAIGFLQKQVSDVKITADAAAPKGAVTTAGLTMATGKLLGRGTAATGAIEEITLGTNLSLSGTTLNATGGTGGGDVTGPVSAVNGNVVLFDGITGKLIKDSGLALSGTNTGDETAARIGTLISGATDKPTPVDSDLLALSDSAAANVLKKLTWANLKATIKAYTDTLYEAAITTLPVTKGGTGVGTLTGLVKGTGTTAFAAAVAGTDYQAPIGTISGIAKGNGANALTAAVAGTDYISPTGTETVTNKTVEAGTFTNGYTEETATANTGAAYTIDLVNGSLQILTLTANCTFTFPTATAGKSFMVLLKQDATGSRTVTWPAAVKWPSGTAPTITATASKTDKLVFTADGTNWIGSVAGQNYTL